MIKPILFNTDMVQAILDGRKTVTRRICKDGNDFTVPDMSFYDINRRTYAVHNYFDKWHTEELSLVERLCPICLGDILYVRETWHKYKKRVGKGEGCHIAEFYGYKASIANSEDANEPWKPCIHMPKEVAHIWLKVTDVRVEQLQDITEEQVESEGVDVCDGVYRGYADGIEMFAELWNSTIKQSDLSSYGWDANPWVWVIEFERCEKPDVKQFTES